MAVFLSFSRRITFALTLFSLPENKVNVFAKVGGEEGCENLKWDNGYVKGNIIHFVIILCNLWE